MILERTNRLKIQAIKQFEFATDPRADIEGDIYNGDSGKIYDLLMPFEGRTTRILLFDSKFGRDKLIPGRFIYGRNARKIYRRCCATTAKALERFFPEVLGYVERVY